MVMLVERTKSEQFVLRRKMVLLCNRRYSKLVERRDKGYRMDAASRLRIYLPVDQQLSYSCSYCE